MLILSRRCQEKIVLDDAVTVDVLRTCGDRVIVRVQAPVDVAVRRRKPAGDVSLDCGPVLVGEVDVGKVGAAAGR